MPKPSPTIPCLRTTGKLPLWHGHYVLASRVGEAARVLPEEMLVPFAGGMTRPIPRAWPNASRPLAEPERLGRGRELEALAARHYDYRRLAHRLRAILEVA